MIYTGKAIKVTVDDKGIAELNFDLKDGSVNVFNELTVEELRLAAAALNSSADIKGLIISSGKEAFIVGADITEFGEKFKSSEDELATGILEINNHVFNVIEDLPFPTVTIINGLALGGGLEMALTSDYRVMAATAKIGLPETKLGIIPGFGGTVRLPRLIGADNAVEWIAAGKEHNAQVALATGVADVVVETKELREAAIDLLQKCIDGTFDYKTKRQEKLEPLKLNHIEAMMSFETAKAHIAGQAGPHYPAPVAAVKAIQKAASMTRDDALAVEAKFIAKLAKTEVSRNLIQLFLGDQALTKAANKWAGKDNKISRAAVLGAGIMGGGIAYQSAFKDTPIIMKDIDQAGIDLGLSEASKLLSKRVNRGRMSAEDMADTLTRIQPQLSYETFDTVDIVVEAVVENPKVKQAVLVETEQQLREDAILTSNTSTISITHLAEVLQRPENFCGMHFFNPVHQMPLVEVIRGKQSSDQAIARTVAYALAMGKKPVVVNDCPGFLVNRILAPYFGGFTHLLKDGADFSRVDRIMEKFGMPMGPAYLADVVGIDTAVHAGKVMAEGIPSRMTTAFKTTHEVLFEQGRYGQKTNLGYYRYEKDRKGKPQKLIDESVTELLAPHVDSPREFTDEEIIDRMILPLCLEAVRCFEEGIASSASDIDMALIYGIGFPPFRGGALHYIQDIGLTAFIEKADQYAELGEAYQCTDKLRGMAAKGETFFA